MSRPAFLLVAMLCSWFTPSVADAQHQLHAIEPPDATATYATLGFCGFSGISLEQLKAISENDEDLVETVKATRSLRSRDGVIVTGILSGSAAELSGLKPFDVINSVNGTRVTTLEEAATEFARVKPPAKVECRIQRSGQRGNRVFWRANKVDISTTSYLTFCILATDTDRDEVEKTTVLSHKDQPNRWFNSYVDLQAVQFGDKPAMLRLTFNYSSDDWLFVKSTNFVTDAERLDFDWTSPTRDADVVSGRNRLHERESFVLNDAQITQLRSIITGRQTGTIRFTGDTYRKDVPFGSSTLERMKVVFDRWAITNEKPMIAELIEPPPAEQVPVAKKPMAKPELRTFADRTGKFSVDAFFVGSDEKSVTLRKQSGEKIVIPLSRLSDNDQEWVKDRSD